MAGLRPGRLGELDIQLAHPDQTRSVSLPDGSDSASGCKVVNGDWLYGELFPCNAMQEGKVDY